MKARPLHFDAYHPQGLVRGRTAWHLTTVDQQSSRGLLITFGSDGSLVRSQRLGLGDRFHPGGGDGALWIPMSGPSPALGTDVWHWPGGSERPTLAFETDAHLSAIARLPDAERPRFIGFDWDARHFLVIDDGGRILREVPNPLRVAFQDCVWRTSGQLWLGGPMRSDASRRSQGRSSTVLALLDVDVVSVVDLRHVPLRSPRGNGVLRNAIWVEERSDCLQMFSVPDDGRRAVLLSWQLPSAPVVQGHRSSALGRTLSR